MSDFARLLTKIAVQFVELYMLIFVSRKREKMQIKSRIATFDLLKIKIR